VQAFEARSLIVDSEHTHRCSMLKLIQRMMSCSKFAFRRYAKTAPTKNFNVGLPSLLIKLWSLVAHLIWSAQLWSEIASQVL